MTVPQACLLSEVQLVTEGSLHVDKLPMSARDMGVWASLILLASGSRTLGRSSSLFRLEILSKV